MSPLHRFISVIGPLPWSDSVERLVLDRSNLWVGVAHPRLLDAVPVKSLDRLPVFVHRLLHLRHYKLARRCWQDAGVRGRTCLPWLHGNTHSWLPGDRARRGDQPALGGSPASAAGAPSSGGPSHSPTKSKYDL